MGQLEERKIRNVSWALKMLSRAAQDPGAISDI